MPLWITALGTGSIGAVYGFTLFYALKRYLPPIAEQVPSLKELIASIMSIGIGLLGASLLSIDGVNYIGPYGIGMFVGAVLNTLITLRHQDMLRQQWSILHLSTIENQEQQLSQQSISEQLT